jgi:hypothetical protein
MSLRRRTWQTISLPRPSNSNRAGDSIKMTEPNTTLSWLFERMRGNAHVGLGTWRKSNIDARRSLYCLGSTSE